MATTRHPPQFPRPSEFEMIWIAFTESARPFLVPVVDDRTLDQFLDLREKVYAIIQDRRFILDLDRALFFPAPRFRQTRGDVPSSFRVSYRDVFLEELRACTRAAEVLQSTDSAPSASEEGRGKSKTQLSKLSTTLGSLKDVLGDTPYLKTGIGLFKELVDYFK